MDPRAAVEHFHLQFLRLLCAGPDKADDAIKGDCNLRFFFGSVRCSEDLDLDVARVPVRTLKGRVDKLLGSPALELPLRARGIRIGASSAPKQTETTQRWKLALALDGERVERHTKVEFSRREGTAEATFDAIDPGFALQHGLQPIALPHDPLPVAIRQKVLALVGRAAVQARDVFDLSVLLARGVDAAGALADPSLPLEAAVERAMELSYDDYAGQVVAYLASEHADMLGTRASWDALQLQVVDALGRARGGP